MQINLQCPINPLGYGQAGYHIFMNLMKNHKVSLWPIGNITVPTDSKMAQAVIQEGINNQSDFSVHSPSLRIWHQFDMAQRITNNLAVGMPIFELDTFDNREKRHLASLDRVFVCSEWAKKVVHDQVSDRLDTRVIPLGVDTDVFKEGKPNHYEDGRFIFLNIGKWEIRKGHDVLVEAFNKAFEKNDNVELWMMNHNPFLSEEQEREWHRMYKSSKLGDKIKLLPRVKTAEEVAAVMTEAHCGVFPARAEGWNLELLEMMAIGRPVIATNYSAHTQFCNEDNCRLIEVKQKEEAWDGIWFKGQGNWAALDKGAVDMLTYLMQGEYEAGPTFNRAGVETAKRLSWENTANLIVDNLREMEGL